MVDEQSLQLLAAAAVVQTMMISPTEPSRSAVIGLLAASALLIVKGVLDTSCIERSISCECSSANHAGFTPLVL